MKSIYLYYKMSFVDFPINLLFIIGFVLMVFAWRKKEDQRFLTRLLLIAVLFIPMINQVLVNQIGYDYRMFSLIPVTAMISAYALIRLTNKFLNRRKTIVVSFILVIFLLFQFNIYFLQRPSDNHSSELGIKEYVLQQIVDYIASHDNYSHYYVLNIFVSEK